MRFYISCFNQNRSKIYLFFVLKPIALSTVQHGRTSDRRAISKTLIIQISHGPAITQIRRRCKVISVQLSRATIHLIRRTKLTLRMRL